MARIVNATTYRAGKFRDEDYGKEYEFDEVLRIGRGEFVDVKMESSYVSECHCFIFNYQGGYYLGDCSTHGTWHPISREGNFVVEEKSKKLESVVRVGNLEEMSEIAGVDFVERFKDIGREESAREVRRILFRELGNYDIRRKLVEKGRVSGLKEGEVLGIFPAYEFQFFEK